MYILGIDLGTTTVKCTIVNKDRNILNSCQVRHHADILFEDPNYQSYNEQNPKLIVQSVDECLQRLKNDLHNVDKISVTGQMHGVMLWNQAKTEITKLNINNITDILNQSVLNTSYLITWQDERCDKEFLQTLPSSPSNCNIYTGFGFASLIWMNRYKDNLNVFEFCGSIIDFLVWLLTQSDSIQMTDQVANSWGYFDIKNQNWELKQLEEVGIINKIKLPLICSNSMLSLEKVISLSNVYGFPEHVEVFPSLGDMQCSIAATKPCQNEAILNIGTSSQLSFLITKNEAERFDQLFLMYPGLSMVPYSTQHYVITAASLNGGNVISQLASFIHSCISPFVIGINHSEDTVYQILESSAEKYDKNPHAQELNFNPTLFAERFNSSLSGSITDIKPNNFNIETLSFSAYKGIISNLSHMLPGKLLREFDIDTIVCVGGLVTKSQLMQKFVKEIFQMDVRVVTDADASYGAAILRSYGC